jgi:hypothetical protein
MPRSILYIDRSRIRPGKADELRRGVRELVAFVEEREPRLLFYGFDVDEPAGRMTTLAIHPDAASLEHHMDVGAEAFRALGEYLDLESIDVFGEVTDRVREQLDAKARDLGERGTVRVSAMHAGFDRLTAELPEPR